MKCSVMLTDWRLCISNTAMILQVDFILTTSIAITSFWRNWPWSSNDVEIQETHYIWTILTKAKEKFQNLQTSGRQQITEVAWSSTVRNRGRQRRTEQGLSGELMCRAGRGGGNILQQWWGTTAHPHATLWSWTTSSHHTQILFQK